MILSKSIGIIIVSRYTMKFGHEKRRRRNHEMPFHYNTDKPGRYAGKVIENYDL